MSKTSSAGELRTSVTFKKVTRVINSNGFPTETETVELTTWCKWVNVHGNDSFKQDTMLLNEPAIITTRYSPKLLNPALLVYRGNDAKPFEIISIDNVEERNHWVEIRVQRKEAAR